jgi:glutamate formiminotransferase/formiminotetrahydrofolate cyclodeaminase
VLGPAGATVIGARSFLIAFNVYLATDDLTIADKIARSVRHSSGGMRYVKALGMLVDGRAQVSMNLTNFRKTPVAQVVEFIRREAARYGTSIHHSELVGLIPQDALEDAAVWYLQLDQFLPDQVLEKRLYAALQADAVVKEAPDTSSLVDHVFLEALSAATPTPGGGSAAAYAASMAAALLLMVSRLTIGKKKYADVEQEMLSIEEKASLFYTELLQAVSKDAAAFQSVMEAYRLPKQTPEEIEQRSAQIQAATLYAAEVPLSVAQNSVELLKLAQQLVLKGNINAISDAGSAAALAGAALIGAGLNVRINAPGLENKADASQLIDEIDNLERQGEQLGKDIREQLNERGGLS